MERLVTPPRRGTSPTWGPPPPCEQALSLPICSFQRVLFSMFYLLFTSEQWGHKLFCLFLIHRITTENYLDDNNWHHYCISFSGESGIFTQYKDGIKSKSETGAAFEYDGGGVLEIGQKFEQAYQITGFNLWNRVLPPEEITDLATSCLKGIGNVKHWFDFSDLAKAISSMKVIAPSVCHPPAQRRTVEETEEPTA